MDDKNITVVKDGMDIIFTMELGHIIKKTKIGESTTIFDPRNEEKDNKDPKHSRYRAFFNLIP